MEQIEENCKFILLFTVQLKSIETVPKAIGGGECRA